MWWLDARLLEGQLWPHLHLQLVKHEPISWCVFTLRPKNCIALFTEAPEAMCSNCLEEPLSCFRLSILKEKLFRPPIDLWDVKVGEIRSWRSSFHVPYFNEPAFLPTPKMFECTKNSVFPIRHFSENLYNLIRWNKKIYFHKFKWINKSMYNSLYTQNVVSQIIPRHALHGSQHWVTFIIHFFLSVLSHSSRRTPGKK